MAVVSVWSILFMFNAGMRLAAPSFFWSTAFITVVGIGRSLWAGDVQETRPFTRQVSSAIAPRRQTF